MEQQEFSLFIFELLNFFLFSNICGVWHSFQSWCRYFRFCVSLAWPWPSEGLLIYLFNIIYLFVCFWRNSPQWAMASSFTRFLDHTQRRTIVGRSSLDEWSARRGDLHLTTHNTHNRQTSMPPVGFDPTVSAGERPQTHALDRAATGTGI